MKIYYLIGVDMIGQPLYSIHYLKEETIKRKK